MGMIKGLFFIVNLYSTTENAKTAEGRNFRLLIAELKILQSPLWTIYNHLRCSILFVLSLTLKEPEGSACSLLLGGFLGGT